jgi:hypothetical protein
MGNLGLKPKKNREFYDWFMITDMCDIDLYWFILIYIDLYWFMLIYVDLYWLMLIHDKWGPHIGDSSEKICRFGGIIFIEKRPVYKLGVSPWAGWANHWDFSHVMRDFFQWLRSHQRMSGKTSVHFADFMWSELTRSSFVHRSRWGFFSFSW